MKQWDHVQSEGSMQLPVDFVFTAALKGLDMGVVLPLTHQHVPNAPNVN